MTLKEAILQSIDQLDNDALSVVYDQIKLLQMPVPESSSTRPIPTIEEIWEMGGHDKSNWSDDIIAAREDRL